MNQSMAHHHNPSRFHALIGCAGLLWLGACASSSSDSLEPGSSLAQAPDTVTTDGDVALNNLSSQIRALEQQVDAGDPSFAQVRQLVDLLLVRTQYEGRYNDFEKVDALTEDALTRNPDRIEAKLLRARFLSTIHEFEAADEMVAALEDPSLSPGLQRSIEARRVLHAVALFRDLDEALVTAQRHVEAQPDFAAWANLAVVQGALGDFEDADLSFVRALETTQDASPFPYAFIAFQRGVMWGESADRADFAATLYGEALRRLPQYVVANVHQAELEFEGFGSTEEGLARLERSAEASQDPEPKGALAARLRATNAGEEARAQALVEDATAQYDRLLTLFPKAFADHGSEFFADPLAGNDPERAVRLAASNLEHRKNPRAYIVTIDAHLAAGNQEEACAVARVAQPLETMNPSLAAVIDDLREDCAL